MCNLCNINEITKKGTISNFSFGWTVYLSKSKKFIVTHELDRIELPFKYCPVCGREL